MYVHCRFEDILHPYIYTYGYVHVGSQTAGTYQRTRAKVSWYRSRQCTPSVSHYSNSDSIVYMYVAHFISFPQWADWQTEWLYGTCAQYGGTPGTGNTGIHLHVKNDSTCPGFVQYKHIHIEKGEGTAQKWFCKLLSLCFYRVVREVRKCKWGKWTATEPLALFPGNGLGITVGACTHFRKISVK